MSPKVCRQSGSRYSFNAEKPGRGQCTPARSERSSKPRSKKKLEFRDLMADKGKGERGGSLKPPPWAWAIPKMRSRSRHLLAGDQGMQRLIEQYLRTYQGRLKPSTFTDYRSILQHHISRFASFEAINHGLEEYLAALDVSGKRKNNILSAARSFVEWAIRRELWPGRLYKIPRFKGWSSKIKPLSPTETRLIMAYAPPPYKDYFQFGILTGVRTGEALGLQFEDFNLKEGTISIRRALTRGQVVSTKTEAGERDIPLHRPVWEIYQRRFLGNTKGSPWFFYSHKEGAVISRKALARAWREVLKAFEISPRPLYATRHTFASLAIASGEDPLWVAKTMGHSRPDQLFLKYGSFLEGVKRDGEKIIELVIGKQSFLRVAP